MKNLCQNEHFEQEFQFKIFIVCNPIAITTTQYFQKRVEIHVQRIRTEFIVDQYVKDYIRHNFLIELHLSTNSSLRYKQHSVICTNEMMRSVRNLGGPQCQADG